MPEALETEGLIGTVIGALARASDDAAEAAAILRTRASDILSDSMLDDTLMALESVSVAHNLAFAAIHLLKSDLRE